LKSTYRPSTASLNLRAFSKNILNWSKCHISESVFEDISVISSEEL
jgi:hypothetical protein